MVRTDTPITANARAHTHTQTQTPTHTNTTHKHTPHMYTMSRTSVREYTHKQHTQTGHTNTTHTLSHTHTYTPAHLTCMICHARFSNVYGFVDISLRNNLFLGRVRVRLHPCMRVRVCGCVRAYVCVCGARESERVRRACVHGVYACVRARESVLVHACVCMRASVCARACVRTSKCCTRASTRNAQRHR